jgi:hypothetical protein
MSHEARAFSRVDRVQVVRATPSCQPGVQPVVAWRPRGLQLAGLVAGVGSGEEKELKERGLAAKGRLKSIQSYNHIIMSKLYY